MIEQEEREQAIYKMVIDVYGHLFETLPSYYEVVKDIRSGRYSDLVKLYDKGYRKVEDVVKEIMDWLNINTHTIAIYKKGFNVFLKERFGVEIKEIYI